MALLLLAAHLVLGFQSQDQGTRTAVTASGSGSVSVGSSADGRSASPVCVAEFTCGASDPAWTGVEAKINADCKAYSGMAPPQAKSGACQDACFDDIRWGMVLPPPRAPRAHTAPASSLDTTCRRQAR